MKYNKYIVPKLNFLFLKNRKEIVKMNSTRLEILRDFITIDKFYKQILILQPNYCNVFELNKQLFLVKEFSKKTEELNLALKEYHYINQFLPTVIEAKEVHRLIIRRMELLDIIELHNKIPDNFPYTLQEMLEYIDYTEYIHKNVSLLN